ncbi:hypothetical protein [Kamptonema formosum]|uniref:hypothetical protein n=1 Tax=Kamptonema formosum TaxID=331992 RepID=UPI000475A6DA|nr:hypothetical protein [Oscillatoria sp. PCC 10802]
MGLELEKVVPWGRCMDEYIRMFDLTPADLQLSVLDCAGGPASFNAEMTRQGYKAISCDPIYQFTAHQIAQRIEESYSAVIGGVYNNINCYVWQEIQSPENLGRVRMAAMRQFLEDLPVGVQEGRYVTGELPVLPFNTGMFDLALCSHFLFTYSDHLSQEFHLDAILEMCRVAREVRIFPLLKISGEVSPWLQPVMGELAARGYGVERVPVPYEFQKGGNQMLRVELRNRVF